MLKCVKIVCSIAISNIVLTTLQKAAKESSIEGVMHVALPDSLKIVACGTKEGIEAFVDAIYREGAKKKPFDIEVEPFIKDKDYRGVFRIIQ